MWCWVVLGSGPEEVDDLLGGGHGEESAVELLLGRDGSTDGGGPVFGGHDPGHGGVEAVCGFVAARGAVCLVGQALPHDDGQVLGGHVTLEEPVPFVVAGCGDEAEVGLEGLGGAVARQAGLPAGGLGLDLDELEVAAAVLTGGLDDGHGEFGDGQGVVDEVAPAPAARKAPARKAGPGMPPRKAGLGGPISSGPVTYQVDGAQYVGVAAGNGYFVFGLRVR